jgi:hypothetical protein
VGDILVANCAALVGASPAVIAGVEALVQLSSPLVYPPPYNMRALIRWIDESHRIFTERFPKAAEIPEIRVQAASMIARAATYCASRTPFAVSRWYLESARYHLPTFARGAARFLLTSARAALRRRPAPSVGSKPGNSTQESR